MELRRIKISELNAAEYNPRTLLSPGDPEFEKLKRSINTFGEVEPIVWNERTGRVVGGHQRLAVLRHMGKTETTVSVVNMDDDQEKLLNVALNKIKGTWDHHKLEEMLADFDPEDATLSGFDPQELAIMLADNEGFDDDFGYDDDEEESEEEAAAPGTSFLVTLVFESAYIAQQWAADNGYPKAIKDGARTTVIRMQ